MGMSKRGIKFGTFILGLEAAFIVVIGVFGKYPDSNQISGIDFPNFQDVNFMIFMGIGMIMSFMKNYGFSTTGLNLLVGVVMVQWAIVVRGFIGVDVLGGEKFNIGLNEMLTANFATATVLISFCVVLGKTSPMQLLIMGLIELVLAQANEYIGVHLLHVKDIGESNFIHVFAAYFGLAVSRMLYSEDVEISTKEGSVYHSDIFCIIGTLVLWIYWPTFNGGFAGEFQERAYLNTFLSLCAGTAVTFAISSLLSESGKFNMVHIQNSALAGGVAVGAIANFPIEPFGALIMGSLAGTICVLGFHFLTPVMTKRLKIHDSCGVHNLHGLPGILSVVASAVMAAMSSNWGDDQYKLFPEMAPMGNNSDIPEAMGRSPGEQGAYHILALAITMGVSIVGGIFVGLLLKLPIWDAPRDDNLFDDTENWDPIPEEGVPPTVQSNNYKLDQQETPMHHKLLGKHQDDKDINFQET